LEATGAFWKEVRAAWADLYARTAQFTFRDEREGRAMFEPMFDYAARLEAGEPYDADDARTFIRATIDDYVE
jgi:hypothetical protein